MIEIRKNKKRTQKQVSQNRHSTNKIIFVTQNIDKKKHA